MSKSTSIILLSIVLLVSCKPGKRAITDYRDYAVFITADKSVPGNEIIDREIAFWREELSNDTNSTGKMQMLAKHLQAGFALTGDIQDLLEADSLLRKSSRMLANTDAGLLEAIVRICITRHEFREAGKFLELIRSADHDPVRTFLLDFDISFELGRYDHASNLLSSYPEKTSFNYLIRFAKLMDQKGQSGKSIQAMELASEKVKTKNSELYLWSLSNLADMYGHAGMVDKAYKLYLEVLKRNPSDYHCLKGIAWIAWSHDKNASEALRISDYILSRAIVPDLCLQRSEIYSVLGNAKQAKLEEQRFLKEIDQKAYGNMYNKYLLELKPSVQLAEQEVRNRPTPETWCWLAWANFQNGQSRKALNLIWQNVLYQCYEPDVLFKAAVILQENGNGQDAEKLFHQCLDAEFELGPGTVLEIRERLTRFSSS